MQDFAPRRRIIDGVTLISEANEDQVHFTVQNDSLAPVMMVSVTWKDLGQLKLIQGMLMTHVWFWSDLRSYRQ